MVYILTMHEVNIKNIDLNLLVALDALLREGNVTRAAAMVNLSQPAMSRALDRLRATLQDPLLVRSGRSMVLTPRAESLRAPLQEALDHIKAVMAPHSFDPAQSRERFRIVGADYVSRLVLPSLLEELFRQAPHIEVEVEHQSAGALEELRDGKIDLGIGVLGIGPRFDTAYAQALFEDRFVCMMRRAHPLANVDLTLKNFSESAHALLSVTGRGGGEIDRRLSDHGMSRRIALRLSHFNAIHSVIAKTDLITTIPLRLAQLVRGEDLVIRDLPSQLQGPGFTVSQIWHERFHADPARQWLRGVVKSVSSNCPRIHPGPGT